MVEVVQGGEEGALHDLCLLEVLILEHQLFDPPLEIVLARGVLVFAVAPTRVVVAWASLLPDVLGAAGNEEVRVTTVVASILDPPCHRFRLLLWNRVNRLAMSGSSSSQGSPYAHL
jgi:hypothetical protein